MAFNALRHVPQKGQYTGSWSVFRSIQSHSGWKGLYFVRRVSCIMHTMLICAVQGVLSPLVGSMAENATLFASYGLFKRAFNRFAPADIDAVELEEWVWCSYDMKHAYSMPTSSQQHSNTANILAGCGAGVFVAGVLTPVELIKCKLQACVHVTGVTR